MFVRNTRGLKVTSETHVGHVRNANEDALYVDPNKDLFIIADGMGGHALGQEASKIAVEEFVKDFKDSFTEAIISADEAVIKLGRTYKGPKDLPGTTIVGATIKNKTLEYCSVGDSYLYLYRNKQLRTINTIDEEPVYGWLTQALGGHYRYLNPHVGSMDLHSEDIIILATDGIDSIFPKDIEGICKEKKEDLAISILEKVLTTDARDNITLICIEIE